MLVDIVLGMSVEMSVESAMKTLVERFSKPSASVCSDLAKRVEEEATGGEDIDGALEPEAQFSLDSLDIIKVAYQKSSF